MAAAVQELFKKVKFAIGPTIENGFYYDFDLAERIMPEDLPRIEKKMKELIRKNLKFEKKEISKAEAKKLFKNQPYKLELIEDLKKVTIYTLGDFVDLCKGPHLKSTGQIKFDAFKLTKLAGAYWKGDEKNKMLQRIYGVAFNTKKELAAYLKQQAQAEKRDHRKLGKELDLFSIHREAQGMPFFHPKGAIIYKELEKFWEEAQKEFNYDFILAPSMLDISIWKQSGHWDHFKDDMYFAGGRNEEQKYALRPMDCPGAILIYNNSPKSYRELPLRYAEPGLITRKEQSGELVGLFRVQQFKQDDAHIFLKQDQIEEEINKVIKLIDKIYKPFNLKYKACLSTRPDDYMGDIKLWNKAEKQLENIIKKTYGKNYEIKDKDGTFYGPKIDYQLEDALGRTWQCATIQLDFQMPLKFNCKYIDKDGQKKIPIMIHRTIIGSFERFIGILIEHYAGAFPAWLAPVQAQIIPVSQKFNKYGKKIKKKLKQENIRAELNDDDDTLGKKIRNGQLQKIPYLLIVGAKEQKAKSVAVRDRKKGDLGPIKIEKFIEKIKHEIGNKK
jgi:threonyl-tRNA synthetase|tara:strand:+ start:19101 stop:20771 length:1671 start_codon:yes stop_codon:yes gene_type:complete